MNTHTILAILLLLQPYVNHAHGEERECVHFDISNKLGTVDLSQIAKPGKPVDSLLGSGLLTDNSWRPIRISFDTSLMDTESDDNAVYLRDTVLPILKSTISNIVSVQGSTSINPFTTSICDQIFTIPQSYATTTTDTDLLIFVRMIYEDSSYLAYAAPCKLNSDYNRPTVGIISINKKSLSISAPDLQTFMSVMIHESLHILVISPILYQLYYTNETAYTKVAAKPGSSNDFVYMLTTSKLLAAAKTHFKCQALKGVFLEDEGPSSSAGAHFEKAHYGNELMTSKLSGYPVLSKLTLALMEDSGWYKVDYGKAQRLAFGEDQGCEFVESTCDPSTAEFCTIPDEMACSKDYIGKTLCKSNTFSNSCYLDEYISEYVCTNQYDFKKTTKYEENGSSSRCFRVTESKNPKGACYKSSCEGGTVIFEMDGKSFACETSGQIIVYKSISVTCPDIPVFCSYLRQACNEDCNGHGICQVDGSCRCDYFYSGPTCADFNGCDSSGNKICSLLGADSGVSVLKSLVATFLALGTLLL